MKKVLGAAVLAASLAVSSTGVFAATVAEGDVLAEEQVLNLKYTDLSLLDVNDVRNANEFQVLTEVQEGLFRTYTEDGVDVVVNAGCTDYEVSDELLTYTFYLNEKSV